MDRIICDICGSEYSAAAEVCPICSYPRQGNEKLAAESAVTERSRVKGGRFSSKNVRRRQAALARGKERSDRGLWITIILLLIAIALVSAYIAQRFWIGWGGFAGAAKPTTQPTTTAAPVETTVRCTGISLSVDAVDLSEAGQQVVLAVKPAPENTTDTVTFSSADPSVAEVSDKGVITAVGPGQTVITVTCGQMTKQCSVICWFLREPSVPVETTVPPVTTQPAQSAEPAVLKLDHEDVSLFQPGESFTIKVLLGDEYIGRSQVTWSTSDPNVATVEKGVVTAVGPGTVSITAKYQGQKAECIVRCQFKDTAWRASVTDVTLTVGQSFQLSVLNHSGETADVVWSVDKEGIVSVDGTNVTGLASGTATLSTTVDGVKLWCIVRVK